MGFIVAIIPFLMATAGFSVCANSGGGNDAFMMKKEQDGSVSKNEFMKHHEWMFDQNDANKNGYLDTQEMGKLHEMVKKYMSALIRSTLGITINYLFIGIYLKY